MAAMTMPVAELPTTLAEAHALILAMTEERAAIEAENSRIASEIAALAAANGNLAAVNQAADARIAELTAIVPRPRKELGAHLERVEIVIEPEVPPGCEGLDGTPRLSSIKPAS